VKPGDLVKPKRCWASRWYGHPSADKIVGLITAVVSFEYDMQNEFYDVLWTGNISEPAAAASALEIVSEA